MPINGILCERACPINAYRVFGLEKIMHKFFDFPKYLLTPETNLLRVITTKHQCEISPNIIFLYTDLRIELMTICLRYSSSFHSDQWLRVFFGINQPLLG